MDAGVPHLAVLKGIKTLISLFHFCFIFVEGYTGVLLAGTVDDIR